MPQLEPIAASIADYALIGDCRTVALVSCNRPIDWLCLPECSSPSVFARRFDTDRGKFSLSPPQPFNAARRYVDGTAILETMIQTPIGFPRILDCLSILDSIRQMDPLRELLRIVDSGTATISMRAAMDAVSLMLGVAVRLLGAVGVVCVLDFSIEWSLNYVCIFYALGIFAAAQSCRDFGFDNPLAKHLIPGLCGGDGLMARALAVRS